MCIHIGYPKAASSWLQRDVFESHPALRVFRYEGADAERQQWMLHLDFADDLDYDPRTQRRAFEQLAGPIDEHPHLLTHERLIGDPFARRQYGGQMAKRLAATFPDARVLVVIRNQVTMLDSLYKQYVHSGGALSFRALVNARHPSRHRLHLKALRYHRLINEYVRLFGRERVMVCLFERLIRDPERALQRVWHFVGVQPIALEGGETANTNRQLSPPLLQVQRTANRVLKSAFNPAGIVPGTIDSTRAVRVVLQRHIDPIVRRLGVRTRRAVDPDTEALVHELSAPGNRRLRDEFGLPLQDFGYPL